MINALTVDVEDYFQVSAFEHCVPRNSWPRFECRAVENTHRLLNLFERHQVRGTFFVLGWLAARYPNLVRAIQRAGHELASHSFWHRLIYRLTPEEFAADLARSCDAIQQITGEPVRAYRAPSFSITRRSSWALPILAEQGIVYDSSIFPVRHDRYGIPDAPRFVHRVASVQAPLWEFPPAVARLARQHLPLGGGGYLRLYPLNWTIRGLRWINRRHAQPFLIYVHPWEVDPAQPRVAGVGRLANWRHRVNLASTESKLDYLLRHFRFETLSQVILQQTPAALADQHAAGHAAGGLQSPRPHP